MLFAIMNTYSVHRLTGERSYKLKGTSLARLTPPNATAVGFYLCVVPTFIV